MTSTQFLISHRILNFNWVAFGCQVIISEVSTRTFIYKVPTQLKINIPVNNQGKMIFSILTRRGVEQRSFSQRPFTAHLAIFNIKIKLLLTTQNIKKQQHFLTCPFIGSDPHLPILGHFPALQASSNLKYMIKTMRDRIKQFESKFTCT